MIDPSFTSEKPQLDAEGLFLFFKKKNRKFVSFLK